MSHSRVDAGGVRAEWVEAHPASFGQPTIIYLHACRSGGASLETVRALGAELAIVTGARVLTVECATVADGVTAYTWLLGEGLDLDTTAFLSTPSEDDLPAAVRIKAEKSGLPLPLEHRSCRASSGDTSAASLLANVTVDPGRGHGDLDAAPQAARKATFLVAGPIGFRVQIATAAARRGP